MGGREAKQRDFPFIVAIMRYRTFSCGGSIISTTWVLTAAHCARVHHRHIKIYSGSKTIYGNGITHDVRRIIVHKAYNDRTNENDIALISVIQPFQLSNYAKRIRLISDYDELRMGTAAVIAGWGTGNKPKNVLHYATVPIVPRTACSRLLGIFIRRSWICAGYLRGGIDTCTGDSGGPLIVRGRLTGVTSFGFGCAMPRAPGVYMRVSYYRWWIHRNTRISLSTLDYFDESDDDYGDEEARLLQNQSNVVGSGQ